MRPSSRPAPHPSSVKLLFALTLASLIFSSLAQRYLGNILAGPNLDFYDYYFAASVLRHDPHADLYAGATDGNPQLRSAPATSPIAQRAAAAGFPDIELYLYPPLLADLLIPLTRLTPHLAATLWRALNLALVFASTLLLASVLRLPWLSFPFAALVAAAFAFWPVHEAVSLGQASLLILFLWTLGLHAYLRDHIALSAAAFALCTVLKVTPILIVPLFLIWRERRWLLAYAASLAALIAAMFAFNGPATLRTCVRVLTAMSGSVPALQNKCFGSLLAWLHYGRLPTLQTVQPLLNAPPTGLLLLAKPIALAFYALCLALVWRTSSPPSSQLKAEKLTAQESSPDSLRRNRALTLAIFALVLATISPVSWRHGYTVALLPLAMLWAQTLQTPATNLLRPILLALTTITLGSLCFDLAAQTPLPQPLKILFAATWLLFSAALCLQSLWHPSNLEVPG